MQRLTTFFLPSLLCLFAWSFPLLAQQQEKPLDFRKLTDEHQPVADRMAALFLLLDDEQAHIRIWAGNELASLGEPVFEAVQKRYPSASYQAKREMITMLGKMSLPAATDFLLNHGLLDLDYGVRNRACLTLLDLCEKDEKLLAQVKALRHKNPPIQKSIETLLRSMLYKKIEQHLAGLASPQGGLGFYQGQFDGMLYLKGDAADPLVEIFTKPDYAFVTIEYEENDVMSYTIRYLAGQAIPSFARWMRPLQKEQIQDKLRQMVSGTEEKEKQLREVGILALYFLGETSFLRAQILDHESEIQVCRMILEQRGMGEEVLKEYKSKIAESYSELGLIYLHIRQEKKGVELLQKAIAFDPSSALPYYNLACAYSCLAKIEDALSALEAAVERGYEDYQWMLKDGDLRNLHKTERFQKIIKKLQDKAMGN